MSIISRNIDALGNKFSENIRYRDIDYRGFVPEGESPAIIGSACMVNDMKLWLQSSKGDYYRRVTMGGFFDDNLREYPLTVEGSDALKLALKTAAEKEFPTVEIVNLDTTPDVTRRGWKIAMIVRDRLTGAIAPLSTGIAVNL